MALPGQIAFDAPPDVRAALGTLGRTEDVRFAPSGRRLALAGFRNDRIAVADVEIAGTTVAIRRLRELGSSSLHDPHGVDFLDEETLVVGNRKGGVVVFRLSAASEDRVEWTEPLGPVVQAAAIHPAPAPVVAVAPAPPPARPTLAALAATAVSEAKAVLASVLPVSQAPVTKPTPRRAVAARSVGKSPTVVQHGAYGSPKRVLTAWNGAARKYAALKTYRPMSARFASPKGTFYRLSVQGFNNLGEANSLCNSLRRNGGSCFVRNFAGDTPVQYASR